MTQLTLKSSIFDIHRSLEVNSGKKQMMSGTTLWLTDNYGNVETFLKSDPRNIPYKSGVNSGVVSKLLTHTCQQLDIDVPAQWAAYLEAKAASKKAGR